MADVSLGTFTGNGSGSMVSWAGGVASVIIGANSKYTMGTATVEVRWSDINNVAGLRTLKTGGTDIITTTILQVPMMIPQGFLRVTVSGATGGENVEVLLRDFVT